MSEPIDAVITWVDGDDPAHLEKRRRFAPKSGKSGDEATRFSALQELEYCLASLLRHAPFLRNIYIVTDSQRPAVLDRMISAEPALASRIHLIDHKVIFEGFEHLLPSFNSLAIISMIWRIPGLARRFIIFNDDVFLIRPVQETDFFTDQGPILYGRWFSQALRFLPPIYHVIDALRGRKGQRFSLKQVQIRAARLAGVYRRFLVAGHTPHPVEKDLVEGFFAKHPKLLSANAAPRFREPDQFAFSALANHLAIRSGRASVRKGPVEVFIRADVDSPERVREKLQRAASDASACFMCVGSLDLAKPEVSKEITDWLDACLPGAT